MKKLLLLTILTGCATVEPSNPVQMCAEFCQATVQTSRLAYLDDTCVCHTEDGIKSKLGLCTINKNDPNSCVFQAFMECQELKVTRKNQGFCTQVDGVVLKSSPNG